MPSQEHTPGPWSYSPESPNRVTGPRGETVAATYGGMVGDKEQLANARLIASAPTMLEYLTRRAQEGDPDALAILEEAAPKEEADS